MAGLGREYRTKKTSRQERELFKNRYCDPHYDVAEFEEDLEALREQEEG